MTPSSKCEKAIVTLRLAFGALSDCSMNCFLDNLPFCVVVVFFVFLLLIVELEVTCEDDLVLLDLRLFDDTEEERVT